ncbi:MAG: Nif3-like dinuclear metal center hexameric protein [Spirochaetales bacterium]
MKLMHIETLDLYFRSFLPFEQFEATDPSLNGFQVGRRSADVQKVAFAVDACQETFHRASLWGADVLVVHHGIFWGRAEAIRGPMYVRVQQLIERDLALYAVHLPLDQHLVYGNNAQMAMALELTNLQAFGHIKGQPIGCRGDFEKPVLLEEINRILFGGTENTISVLPFGPQHVRNAGFVSGGGGSAFDEAVELGLDLFVTGDASHTLYHRALETSMNVVFGGHYLTEIWGVKALAEKLSTEYPDIETTFIDVPTGL